MSNWKLGLQQKMEVILISDISCAMVQWCSLFNYFHELELLIPRCLGRLLWASPFFWSRPRARALAPTANEGGTIAGHMVMVQSAGSLSVWRNRIKRVLCRTRLSRNVRSLKMRTASRLLLRALCGRRPALRSPQVNPGTSTRTTVQEQQYKNNSTRTTVQEQYKSENQNSTRVSIQQI